MTEHLRIEPGAAERIAGAFETHADNLEDIAGRLRNDTYSTGFAGLPSAQELDAGFRNKQRLAVAHLLQQAETSRRHAATIRAAGGHYAATETANDAALRSIDR